MGAAILENAVYATYTYDASDGAKAEEFATQIASGQTLGFLPKDSSWNEWLAKVVKLEQVGDKQWTTVIAFPGKLFGQDIAGLVTVLFGKISFAPHIKLTELSCDAVYAKFWSGPRLGLSGIMQRCGVDKSPLLMAILKPGIGPAEKISDAFAELSGAGVHIVKDDEVCIDASIEQSKRRLELVLKRKKGKTLYVQHLSGASIFENALALQKAGAEAFLFCPFTYGLEPLQRLCTSSEIKVPIFVHPAFTGPMTTGTNHVSPAVLLGTLMRWCGADAVLYPSPYGSIALPKNDALALHAALTSQSHSLTDCASVPSAGISVQHIAAIQKDFGDRVIINAGTGMAKGFENLHAGVQAFLKEMQRVF